jgi:hypothetical protein
VLFAFGASIAFFGANREALAADAVPCSARSYAVVANTADIVVNSSSLVDSYQSSLGAYGPGNVGSNAIVKAAASIANNGGIVEGGTTQNSFSGFAIVPVAARATNLPLGSASPGSLNINEPSDDITLAPGDYVAANINVQFPAAINISPPGHVRIWVTGNLNLGGNENVNGVPNNLAFLVTSSGWVNVNGGGALYGLIYAPTSVVNLHSPVFGSVIGSSVTLNSGAALHFDQSTVCAQANAMVTPSGAYVHDGFYLRLGLGAAYTGLWGDRPPGSRSLGGAGIALTLALGGTIGNGLVLGGIVHVTDGESSGRTGSTVGPGTVYGSLVEFAFLVDWYPDPQKGWHIGGTIGFGGVEVIGSNESLSGIDLTGSILGGYDWWIGPQWSLGLVLIAAGGSKTTLNDSSGVDSGYHLGAGSMAVEASILLH